jgi:hypothetical protein
VAEHRIPRARALGIWLLLVATESVHGIVRGLLLEPQLGDLRAREVSVLTGAVLIALVFWLTLPWLGSQSVRRWWQLVVMWLVVTLAFELALGRAVGLSWDRIWSDFDPRRGGLLAFGMLIIAVSPRIVAARRGLIRERRS